MSDDRKVRIASIAALMLDGAAAATDDMGEIAAACEYLIQTVEQLAMRGVVERAFGADSPIVRDLFGYRKSAGAHRASLQPVGRSDSANSDPTLTNTEAPQTGDQPASTGLQGVQHVPFV